MKESMNGSSYRFGVIFDWDGTLYDSEHLIDLAVSRAMHALSLPVGGALADGLYRPGHDRCLVELACQSVPPRRWPELRAQVAVEFARLERAAVLKEGAANLLTSLRSQGVALCIATGRSRRRLDNDLLKLGLSDVFAYTVCGDEAAAKPHKACVQMILGALRLVPACCAFVGDSDDDQACAVAAGVTFFRASFRHRGHAIEPPSVGHAQVAQTPEGLLRMLSAWMTGMAATA